MAIVAAILLLFSLPASAVAKPGYEVHRGGIEIILPVAKNPDQVISISASGHQRVQFAVDRPSSTTEYTTKGRVSSGQIDASFGTLGRIDVRLHLVPRPANLAHKGRCKGRSPLYMEGTYRGAIEFSRQGDVPKVSVKRGRVYFERHFRQVCKERQPQSTPGGKKVNRKIEVDLLTVHGKSEGRTVLLQAINLASRQNPARSWGQLAATIYERHESVRIARRAIASLDHHSFVVSGGGNNLETVRVEPPEPFAGSALYLREPASTPQWVGDLSIYLSGTDRIFLTGPSFNAVLCRGSYGIMLARCANSGPATAPF